MWLNGEERKMRKIVRDRILKKYKYKCVNCENTENLEVDHIIPLSRGGREDEDNMQILCRKCNRKKKNFIDFRKYFKIGENPEYILIREDFPRKAFTAIEFDKIICLMFEENNKLCEEMVKEQNLQ